MTLTQAAILTKQAVFFLTLFLIVGIGGFIGYQIWYMNYLKSLPPVEEKPDTKFGLLSIPNFPPSNVSSSNFTYTLDTTTGSLPKLGQDPKFPKIIKVYFVIKPYASLLSSEKGEQLANKFDINSSPVILSDTQYKFTQDKKSKT